MKTHENIFVATAFLLCIPLLWGWTEVLVLLLQAPTIVAIIGYVVWTVAGLITILVVALYGAARVTDWCMRRGWVG